MKKFTTLVKKRRVLRKNLDMGLVLLWVCVFFFHSKTFTINYNQLGKGPFEKGLHLSCLKYKKVAK